MKKSIRLQLVAAVAAGLLAVAAHADDIEGTIEAVDAQARTLTVQGITFITNDRTDYDDGLRGFEDLKVGQRVEVDFKYRDGQHIATEIELED